MNVLENIRIVLVDTTHPGNIGAVARAMKNMGLSQLFLVNPKLFPHVEATARAAGADDILQKAFIVTALKEALKKCQLVVGTSVRERSFAIDLLDSKEAARKIVSEADRQHEVAIVFGAENSGLSNADLQLCNFHLRIPTEKSFCSLNLAAAVLIISYEIKMAFAVNTFSDREEKSVNGSPLADFDDMELFFNHLKEILLKIEFLNPKNPRHLMPRFRRLFSKIRPTKSEINILRGVLTKIEKKL